MLSTENIEQFSQTLQRVFALRISKSTYREVQNAAVAATGGDKGAAQMLFESVVRGEAEQAGLDNEAYELLQIVMRDYTIRVRLSRDISEKGEFINLVTSDMLRQGDLFAYLNRIRRIDGEEIQFMTDLDSTIHLLLHFGGRLQELKASEGGPALLASKEQALMVARNQIDALLAGVVTGEPSEN